MINTVYSADEEADPKVVEAIAHELLGLPEKERKQELIHIGMLNNRLYHAVKIRLKDLQASAQ